MIKRLISSLSRQRIRYYGNPGGASRRLYLTFDDGPHVQHTPALLDLLGQHRVSATFFIVGREAYAEPDIVRRIVAEGHHLGNHSITHPRMDFLSDAARDLEIDGMETLLCEFDRRSGHYFRPPYGGVSVSLFSYGLRSGRRMAMWSRDSLDYKYPAEKIVEGFAASPPKAGDIILFHDDGAAAGAALARLLPLWKSQGFEFETLATTDVRGPIQADPHIEPGRRRFR
jgi:peptidoglycan/xylan/chitin deacetylase (PgdA/CDA1 family)